MKSFFQSAFRNAHSEVAALIFLGLFVWWIVLHFFTPGVGAGSEEFLLWGAWYQVIAWYGAGIGFFIAARWGGLRSYMGRAVLAFTLGLLFQSFGQTVYTWYIHGLHIDIPYPSLGDVGFFGSIPFYFYGAYMLAKASAGHISLQSMGNKISLFIIPVILLGFSYYMFLNGYEADPAQPIKTFLDFGYPIGQAVYVSMAIIAYVLSRKLLGGIMRLPVLFFIVALIAQYLSDSTFLYDAANGAYYPANINDLMYCVSYLIMTFAIAYIGEIYQQVKNT